MKWFQISSSGRGLTDFDAPDFRLVEHECVITGDMLGWLVEERERDFDRLVFHQTSIPKRLRRW